MSSMPAANFGAVTIILEANNTPLLLTTTSSAITTGLTYHTAAGVDYQVPADTKFVILGVFLKAGTATKTLSIYQSDAADGVVGEVDKFVSVALGITVDEGHWVPVPDFPEIAASKFCNFKTSDGTNTGTPIYVIGYEVAV